MTRNEKLSAFLVLIWIMNTYIACKAPRSPQFPPYGVTIVVSSGDAGCYFADASAKCFTEVPCHAPPLDDLSPPK